MKIVADIAIPYIYHFFSSLGDLVLRDGREITRTDLLDAEVLIVRTVTRVNRALLEGTPVRLVASATSGHDHVDTEFLEQSGIPFVHAAGCNARSVAEYVLSSLFAVADQKQLNLTEQSVGIIGCGKVGSTLYQFLQTLGIRCLLNDPPLQQRGSTYKFQPIEEVLDADIISLHVPLIKTGPYPTWHLLNRERLDSIRKKAILINTSRGGVIDESALLGFIEAAPQSSVILDVWENEPHINTELLQRVAISTSHIAGYSIDAKMRGTQSICEQAARLLNLPVDNSLPSLPGPNPDRIKLTESNVPLDVIQEAVLSSYDVRNDSRSLKHMLDVPQGGRADYFSSLRNNYPVRREFTAMTVSSICRSNVVMKQLAKLGFITS